MRLRKPVERILPAYRFGQVTLRGFFRLVYRAWEEGLENVPDRGACVVASNHESLLDPPLLATAIPHRQVFFMAKRELFAVPFLGSFLRACGCLEVDREGSDARKRRALDGARAHLEAGRMIGIYPEGTRSRDGRLRPARSGVALLALRTGAPVVPVAVFRTRESVQRRMLPGGPPFGIRFGPPMRFGKDPEPSEQRIQEVRDRVMASIQTLIDQGPPPDGRARKE